jgi:hypothetical protein
MRFTVEISDKRISDFLHGHGGGYSPWLRELTGTWNDKKGAVIKFDREQDNEGDGYGRMTIRRKDIARGLSVMIHEAPEGFADFIQGNDDDIAFDSFLQCIVFGKLVYA